MVFDERGAARGWRLPTWLVVICFVLLAGVCVVPFVAALRHNSSPTPAPTVTCTAGGTATC